MKDPIKRARNDTVLIELQTRCTCMSRRRLPKDLQENAKYLFIQFNVFYLASALQSFVTTMSIVTVKIRAFIMLPSLRQNLPRIDILNLKAPYPGSVEGRSRHVHDSVVAVLKPRSTRQSRKSKPSVFVERLSFITSCQGYFSPSESYRTEVGTGN